MTDSDDQARAPVFNSVPGVVLGLCAAILIIQTLVWWSGRGGGSLLELLYWAGSVRTGAAQAAFPQAPLGGFAPWLLHVFLHFGWMHALINTGALLAFGAAAARPFGPGARGAAGFLAFFFACGVAGAGLHILFHLDAPSTMAGASTAVSGVLAAAGWTMGGRAGMLRLALPWLGVNILLALSDPFVGLPIAWAGHIGGLLAGMIAYPAFVRMFAGR